MQESYYLMSFKQMVNKVYGINLDADEKAAQKISKEGTREDNPLLP